MGTTTQAAVSTGTWKADPVHSLVGFEVDHLGLATFRGRFRDYDATLTVGEDGFGISGVAQVESVDVPDEQLRGHLLSPDFFDAERAPEIRFEASQLQAEEGELRAEGQLTIRGQSRPIEARGRIGEPGVGLAGEERVAVELEAAVDRREFGINVDLALPDGTPVVGNEVRLVAQLELAKED